jgi:glyoxylase-like metal-dependent hydrolase (beta-lactamase superfamily II)
VLEVHPECTPSLSPSHPLTRSTLEALAARVLVRRLQVLHTPGHTPDSLCLWLAHERLLLVGDTLYPHAAVIVANTESSLSQ